MPFPRNPVFIFRSTRKEVMSNKRVGSSVAVSPLSPPGGSIEFFRVLI